MKKILLSIFGLALLGLTACQESPGYKDPDGNGGGDGPKVSSGFTMQIKTPWTPINTYAPVVPVAGENDIYTLHLVFFERTTTGTGAYKGFYSVDIPSNQPLDVNQPVPVDFTLVPGLSDREAYNIYLVANLDYYLPGSDISAWKAQLPQLNETQLVELTRASITGEPDETVYSGGDVPLPMSAITTKEVNESRIEVFMARTVARFDVTSHVKYDYDLVSTSIWNAFPYSSIWNATVNHSATTPVQRFYGIKNKVDSGSPEGIYEDIFGGLYAFENKVTDPAPKDKKTTCLIIGLRNRDTSAPDYGKILYYRINVLSTTNGQDLKRNNSYQVTIRNVLEKGYNTEREAYEGESNRLDVVINYWDLDDDGIIQYDGDNVLAVPMKKINIPREGDEREYSIFTIGRGTLAISRNTVPAGIEVILRGNRLYVNSQPLGQTETERTGEIDLTFGALKATVIIRQSGEIGEYLNVTPTELPGFSAYSATQSAPITVEASGEWKATIFNPGFTFTLGSDVQEITSAQGKTFTVSTKGANTDNTTRFSFVKVSLVSNPEISRTIVLKQLAKSNITLSPVQDYIRFNPDGSLMSGSNNLFQVNPGDDGETDPTINEWSAVLGDPARFEVVEVHDSKTMNNNVLVVVAKGTNSGATSYTTTVKVYLVADPSISKTMTVVQGAYSFSVSPKTFSPIPAAGGSTPAITVSAAAGMKWSATVTTSVNGHKALLRAGNQSVGLEELTGVALSERLYVEFPRITQPNVTPVATVTVTLDGTTLKETFQVTQQALVPRAMHFQSTGTSYSTLMHGYSGYNYFNVFGQNLKNWRYFGKEEQSVVKTTGAIGFSTGKNPSSSTTVYHSNQTSCSTTTMGEIYNWVKRDHRNFLIVHLDIDKSDQQKLLRRFSGQYTVADGCISTTSRKSLAQTPTSYRNNNVWKYITETGPFCNGTAVNLNNTAFYNGDTCNGVLTSWPSTTIPIVMHPTNNNRVVLAVDPVLKLVIIGDGEMFANRNTASNRTIFTEGNDNWKVLNNLIAFIVNAGQYGDPFLQEFR